MKKYSFIAFAAVLVLTGCGAKDVVTDSATVAGDAMEEKAGEMLEKDEVIVEKTVDLIPVPTSQDLTPEEEVAGLALFEDSLGSELAELESFEF